MTKTCRCGRMVVLAKRLDTPGGEEIVLDIGTHTYLIVAGGLEDAKVKLGRGYIDHDLICTAKPKTRKRARR